MYSFVIAHVFGDSQAACPNLRGGNSRILEFLARLLANSRLFLTLLYYQVLIVPLEFIAY